MREKECNPRGLFLAEHHLPPRVEGMQKCKDSKTIALIYPIWGNYEKRILTKQVNENRNFKKGEGKVGKSGEWTMNLAIYMEWLGLCMCKNKDY